MITLFSIPVKRMLVIVLVVLIGCNDSDKNSSLIFEALNESLERSNEAIQNSTKIALQNLEDKSKTPAMAERGIIWLNKANYIVEVSKAINDSIDEVNKRSSVNNEKDLNRIHKLLEKFTESILNCDAMIKKEFQNKVDFLSKGFNTPSNRFEKKIQLYKLKNDVTNIENMVVTYCKYQVGCLDCGGYNKIQVIAATNSSVFKKGQEMIIQAGVGEFNLQSKPSFVINGVDVIPNENGVGEYKIKIRNKPGNYKVHAKIKYLTPDGRSNTFEKDIEYSVIDSPSNDKKAQMSDTISSKN